MNLFTKTYDYESLIDAPEDISYAFLEKEIDLPVDNDGIPTGTFTLTITWKNENEI